MIPNPYRTATAPHNTQHRFREPRTHQLEPHGKRSHVLRRGTSSTARCLRRKARGTRRTCVREWRRASDGRPGDEETDQLAALLGDDEEEEESLRKRAIAVVHPHVARVAHVWAIRAPIRAPVRSRVAGTPHSEPPCAAALATAFNAVTTRGFSSGQGQARASFCRP